MTKIKQKAKLLIKLKLISSDMKMVKQTLMKKTIIGIAATPLLLTGCVSFESYIIFNGKGDVTAVETSIGSPNIGWEAMKEDGPVDIRLLDDLGFLTEEVINDEEGAFDAFIRVSDEVLNNNITSSLIDKEFCQYGVEEDIFIKYCYNESIPEANLLNNAIIDGEWTKTKEIKEVFGEALSVDVYSIEGPLGGIAKEIYDEYTVLKKLEHPQSEEFISALTTPHEHEGQVGVHAHSYITEPVGRMGIIFNAGEIVSASGDAIIDFERQYIIIDLDKYNEGDSLLLEVILTEGAPSENITTNEELESSTSNIILSIISIIALITISILYLRSRDKKEKVLLSV
jgi:hypothetical protein